MYWEIDEKEEEYRVPDDVVDLAFTIECRSLPVDHAWQLSQAVAEHLPWLGREAGSGLHLIHGAESGNGWERPDDPNEPIYLSRRTPLMLRVPKEREADAARLTGKVLTVHGNSITVGKSKRRLLSDSASLYARHAVLPKANDEEALIQQTVAEIQAHGVQFKKVLVGRSSELQTPNGVLHVASLLIADLTKPDAVRLQQLGIGKHKEMGCGLFIAHKTV